MNHFTDALEYWLYSYNEVEKIKESMKNEKQINKLKLSVVAIEAAIKALEEDKPEFEVGKWYKQNPTGHLFCCTSFHKAEGYGFYGYGSWFDNNEFARFEPYTIEPATEEEVEHALIAEAKKRYKDGDLVSSMDSGNPFKIYGGYWMQGKNLSNDACVIFKKGKWAEIISEPKVVINGENMNQDGNIISFGCAKFNKFFFKNLHESINQLNGGANDLGIKHRGIEIDNNRKIKSITLDSGVEITIEQLKLIVDNIK